MSLNAWPSLKTIIYKGCILRLSKGYTKRANSVNPLYFKTDQIKSIISFSERIYKSENLPTVFKITDSLNYKLLDIQLENQNYKKLDFTNIMVKDLANINNSKLILDGFKIDNNFSKEWITSFLDMNKIRDKHKETAVQMLNNITTDLIVASIAYTTLFDTSFHYYVNIGMLHMNNIWFLLLFSDLIKSCLLDYRFTCFVQDCFRVTNKIAQKIIIYFVHMLAFCCSYMSGTSIDCSFNYS